jgi:tetraacyldisaccharide 4'-kinase
MLSERKLQAIWYGGVAPSKFNVILSRIYSWIVGIRRDMYASNLLPREKVPVPVVVVGNINVGGTGKTPLVIALVEALRKRGWNPGVITRGYTGKARDAFVLEGSCNPVIAGEEACLILQRTNAPIAVGRNRVLAARKLLNAAKVDVLIADDGLQHYRLARDVDICVIDGARRFGNGQLLPAGPLREDVSRLSAFTYRICNGGVPEAGEIGSSLIGDEAVALLDSKRRRPLSEFSGQRVHAVAGIGNPARFFAQLRASGMDVIEHPFDDHFPFTAKDLVFGDDLAVLMTEKDAVKCQSFAEVSHWCVPVQAQLPATFLEDLDARLRRHQHQLSATPQKG